MQESKSLHFPWVTAPYKETEFNEYLKKYGKPNNISYIVRLGNNIVGVININEIVMGCFQSGYLGFYATSKYVGCGYMSAGLKLVLEAAFTEHQLHRVEANIQPGNARSINLVQKNNFKYEGLSPRYLNINNKWEDHERLALTLEDWTGV